MYFRKTYTAVMLVTRDYIGITVLSEIDLSTNPILVFLQEITRDWARGLLTRLAWFPHRDHVITRASPVTSEILDSKRHTETFC